MRNLARHLREGGLLLLHLQKPHQNYEKSLGEGVIYSQSIEEVEDTADYHTLLKSYLFKKEEEIVVQEQIKITCFKPEISRKLLTEAGFDFQGTSNSDRFAIYKKR